MKTTSPEFRRETPQGSVRIHQDSAGTWVEVVMEGVVEYLYSPDTEGDNRVFQLVSRKAPPRVPIFRVLRREQQYPLNSYVRFTKK